jgi:hypothetical protein
VFLPVHILPPYREGRVLHNAQRIARRAITLPSAASLKPEDQDYVIRSVREIAESAQHRITTPRQVRVRRGPAVRWVDEPASETPKRQQEAA